MDRRTYVSNVRDSEAFRRQLELSKQNVGHLLIRVARLFNEAAIERFQLESGYQEVRAAHMAVFPHLDLDGTRMTELARRMGVTKQAVSQIVDELERMGVVERRPDPDDGRAKRVTFTDTGRDAMLAGLEVIKSVERDVLQHLSEPHRRRLFDDLTMVGEALDRLKQPDRST